MPKKLTVDQHWGVPFPRDLHDFHEFAKKHAAALDALDLRLAGPLEFLATRKVPEESRYYNDPPEFVTVLGGMIDGLHWGYWFDAPGELEPVVVSYYANDAFELSERGTTLFEAAREHLEALHRDAEDNVTSDPEYADDYRTQLAELARTRAALTPLVSRKAVGDAYLEKYVYRAKSRRKVVANTRSKLGIVVPKKQYRPLAAKDAYEVWNYEPKAAEVKQQFEAAMKALAEGFPGTALKLGHDLWIYSKFQKQSVALLDLAYEKLGRPVLRAQLAKAIAWRRRCDQAR